MRRQLAAALAITTAGMLALTACSSSQPQLAGFDVSGSSSVLQVGVILPDTVSSARYETQDRPLLKAAFDAANVQVQIQNAGGDAGAFQTIADTMIQRGVKVLIIDSLDNDGGALVVAKAHAAHIPVIDYDRLTLGGAADYYVSYDGVKVGNAMGQGLVKCMQANGDNSGNVVELNGDTNDNSATLFKQGYDQEIRSAGYTVKKSVAVPGWDPATATKQFRVIDAGLQDDYVGVAAANDGLAGSVITRLTADHRARQVAVTGQDATDPGLQRVLLGTQCVSVYKPVKQEAGAAAGLAISLLKGDTAAAKAAADKTIEDTQRKKTVPAVLLTPVAIFKGNVKDVIADGATTVENICTTPTLKQACNANGIS
jgi:D-xylose transport system substrate-binding protein